MRRNTDQIEGESFSPFDIWEKGGLTEHLGGIAATQTLIAEILPSPKLHILEVGCGTGYTSSLLAKIPGAKVTACDLLHGNLLKAKTRPRNSECNPSVQWLQADAHRLPLDELSFQYVMLESVLVFCNPPLVLSEIHRVLEPGGKILINEFTFLKPPPARLVSILTDRMGLCARQQEEWERLLSAAGFNSVHSSIHRFSFGNQFVTHLKVDGVGNYFRAMIAGIGDRKIRRTFFNREMLGAAKSFLPYVGYGLYSAIK